MERQMMMIQEHLMDRLEESEPQPSKSLGTAATEGEAVANVQSAPQRRTKQGLALPEYEDLRRSMIEVAHNTFAEKAESLVTELQHLFHAVRNLEARQHSTHDSLTLMMKESTERYKLAFESGGALSADWVAGVVLRAVQAQVRSTSDDLDHRIALQVEEARAELRQELVRLRPELTALRTSIDSVVKPAALREVDHKLAKRIQRLELVTSLGQQPLRGSGQRPSDTLNVAAVSITGGSPRRSPIDQVQRQLSATQVETMREAMQAINWQARLAQFGSPR